VIRRRPEGAGRGSRVQLDGIALIFSTAATAASSLLFWVVAGRSYSTASVGLSSAEINAFTLAARVGKGGEHVRPARRAALTKATHRRASDGGYGSAERTAVRG
jgi:hypothetical protein